MNILKLPNYQDGNKLKIKLLEAIYSGAGFDLSWLNLLIIYATSRTILHSVEEEEEVEEYF